MALFESLVEILPRDVSSKDDDQEDGEGGGTVSATSMVEDKITSILDKVDTEPDEKFPGRRYNVNDIKDNLPREGRRPWQNVLVQELECMNILTQTIVKSLNELKMGLAGSLSINSQMEALMEAFEFERVPPAWAKFAYHSMRSLSSWVENLADRFEQLDKFRDDTTNMFMVTFINKLFNPTSFMNAIKQMTAQDKRLPLNVLYVKTDVTKFYVDQIDERASDGAYVSGFKLEGARWDVNTMCLEDSRPKEIFSILPVVHA